MTVHLVHRAQHPFPGRDRADRRAATLNLITPSRQHHPTLTLSKLVGSQKKRERPWSNQKRNLAYSSSSARRPIRASPPRMSPTFARSLKSERASLTTWPQRWRILLFVPVKMEARSLPRVRSRRNRPRVLLFLRLERGLILREPLGHKRLSLRRRAQNRANPSALVAPSSMRSRHSPIQPTMIRLTTYLLSIVKMRSTRPMTARARYRASCRHTCRWVAKKMLQMLLSRPTTSHTMYHRPLAVLIPKTSLTTPARAANPRLLIATCHRKRAINLVQDPQAEPLTGANHHRRTTGPSLVLVRLVSCAE
mmetsp:Transcript_18505/g.43896  ORF Transcript_18505/g.43896 Transcript_18505/m.43896 type:complete len:308 (+) Transcript_18505:100-1023(+)